MAIGRLSAHSRVLMKTTSALTLAIALASTAQAIVPRNENSGTTSVTFPSIPGPGGLPTTANIPSGSTADANNTLPWLGYSITDLTTLGSPGFIGQCSGSLINPRLFLTAAHCYNSNGTVADTTYGVGGIHKHAVSFRVLPLANNSAANWLNGTPLINGVTSNGFTDVASVRYAPGNITFLQADIAAVTLANPVSDVGTVGLLVSRLDTNRDSIIAGFGLTGTGSTGGTTSSRVRRIVENNIGALGSFDDICVQVYGLAPGCFGALPQDLFWNDFDSPTVAPGTRFDAQDFDVLPGAIKPNEGISAGGDSGGPLLTVINGRTVNVGPLSGGLRFFGASVQPFSSYGTMSFHQPAFLYANWLASVNPTRYYVANAGNFSWNSATAWQEFLDPNFLVLSGGSLVNGLPATDVGIGASPNVGFFNDGSIAPATEPSFQIQATNSVVSLADAGIESAPSVSNDITGGFEVQPSPAIELPPPGDGGNLEPQIPNPSFTPTSPRAPGTVTMTNVAPFPNNINGTNLINGRYFDVTLRNAGTVTLSGISPTIDKITINGASSVLDITTGSTLTSLISPELWNGRLTVNGGLTSANNIWQLGGRLQGTGTLTTGASGKFYGLAGTIAPGNSIGTINYVGAFALGPLATTEIEVDNTSADRINVTGVPGTAEIDGLLVVKAFGTGPEEGDVHRIVQSTGARTGTFIVNASSNQLGGLFNFTTTYGGTFVDITIVAQTFCSVTPNPELQPICSHLDGLRSGGTTPAMDALLNNLMKVNAADIPGALASINPSRVNGQATLGFQTADLVKMQLGHRSTDLLAQGDGSMSATLRAATQVASVGASADAIASAALAAMQTAGMSTSYGKAGWSLFGAADLAESNTDNTSGVDKSRAYAFTAGADYSTGDGVVAGAAVSALSGDVNQTYGLGGETSSEGFAVSAYGGFANDMVSVDGYLSYSMSDYDTARTILIAPATFAQARGETEGSTMQFGATVNVPFASLKNALSGVAVSAVGGVYYAGLDIDGYTETGAGGWSVIVPDRSYESFKGSAGLEFSRSFRFTGGQLVPFVRLQGNAELMDEGISFVGAFAAAPGSPFTVTAPELGGYWGTVAAGATAQMNDNFSFYVRYQTDFGREGQSVDNVSFAARLGF
jgi:uncharacterized protein YhjY with autotransporter beta-barrel domain